MNTGHISIRHLRTAIPNRRSWEYGFLLLQLDLFFEMEGDLVSIDRRLRLLTNIGDLSDHLRMLITDVNWCLGPYLLLVSLTLNVGHLRNIGKILFIILIEAQILACIHIQGLRHWRLHLE